jgi:DNA-binding transcriptional ArsR family regulator
VLAEPFWPQIRAALDRDVEHRSRTLARHGLRRTIDELHPCVRWTQRGVSVADRTGSTVHVDERRLVLMRGAFLAPNVAAIVEKPWLPTIAYPARGVGQLWHPPPAPAEALAGLIGRTRALMLSSLDEPASTTALAARTGFSPGGVSRHLLALRRARLVESARRGHEVFYRRTPLGSALLRGGMGDA